MRLRLLTASLLVAATLAGCAATPGPVANCFTLLEGGAPCDFQPVSRAGGGADGGS